MFDSQSFLKTVTTKTGVYQMLAADKRVIYVGKANNLHKRLSSYFSKQHTSVKTEIMVNKIAAIKVIVTRTENEALILENNLIKKFRPHYNVLFRDDKSYPYIYVSKQQPYPRLDFYRGKHHNKGVLFGPYPSVSAVHQTLQLLQKIFKLRQCRDSFFANRSRPCLQYQIERCSAPCVHLITAEDYQKDVDRVCAVLNGNSNDIAQQLTDDMMSAASQHRYEQAAKYRDQIAHLRRLQSSQGVMVGKGDADVVVVTGKVPLMVVQLLIVRSGQLLAQHSYFPKITLATDSAEVLSSFISHYYLDHKHSIPRKIVLSQTLIDQAMVADSLSQQANRSIQLLHGQRGHHRELIKIALLNAEESLSTRLAAQHNILSQLEALQALLALPQLPQRIECFDVSHTQGEAMVASCVVFSLSGALPKEYRRFNIKGVTKGDDYAAMRQALTRRYHRLKVEQKVMPDLLIIDGGKAQLAVARAVMESLQIIDVVLLGIAKGSSRKAGLETLWLVGRAKPVPFQADDRGLLLLQQIRDEAHRVAIGAHRRQRAQARRQSVLEMIAGVGKKRRQRLLQHFGGLQELKRASVEDLMKVSGINQTLAVAIYQYFHR